MSAQQPQVFLPAGRDALATFAFQHVTVARDNGYWRYPPSKLERRSLRHIAPASRSNHSRS